MKLYVGCALTHAPADFCCDVEELKDKFTKIPGLEMLEFLGLENGHAHDVYVHDIINCVQACDVMIAICDYPSIGLGWEMATQASREKPLLAFANKKSKVTRLILDPRIPNYKFFTYEKLSDVYKIANPIIWSYWHDIQEGKIY